MSGNKVPQNALHVALRRWRVMEIQAPDGNRSRHVWGHDVKHNLGRCSSAIVEFDAERMTATTRSGRCYRLLGLPGNSRLGRSAWRNWCGSNGIVEETDVTDHYLNVNQMSTVGFVRVSDAVLREHAGEHEDAE